MKKPSEIIEALEKAKYIKREGTSGNYKYYYNNGDDPAKGEGKDLHYHIKQAAAHSVESGKDSDAFKYHKEQAKKLSEGIKLNEKNLDSTIDAYGKIHTSDKEKKTPTRDKVKAEKEEESSKISEAMKKIKGWERKPTSIKDVTGTISSSDIPKGIPEFSYKELFSKTMEKEDHKKENYLHSEHSIKTPQYYILNSKSGKLLVNTEGSNYPRYAVKIGEENKKEEKNTPKKPEGKYSNYTTEELHDLYDKNDNNPASQSQISYELKRRADVEKRTQKKEPKKGKYESLSDTELADHMRDHAAEGNLAEMRKISKEIERRNPVKVKENNVKKSKTITNLIDTLEKAKYIKREGTPGRYKYTYAKDGIVTRESNGVKTTLSVEESIKHHDLLSRAHKEQAQETRKREKEDKESLLKLPWDNSNLISSSDHETKAKEHEAYSNSLKDKIESKKTPYDRAIKELGLKRVRGRDVPEGVYESKDIPKNTLEIVKKLGFVRDDKQSTSENHNYKHPDGTYLNVSYRNDKGEEHISLHPPRKSSVKKSGIMVGDSLIKSDFDDFMVKELKK